MFELDSFKRKGQENHLVLCIFTSVSPNCKTLVYDQMKDYSGFPQMALSQENSITLRKSYLVIDQVMFIHLFQLLLLTFSC